VTVAWNKDRQRGAVFLGQAATTASRRYRLWLVPVEGDASAASFGPTLPGQAVYLFNAPPGISVTPAQILLTDWSTSGGPQNGSALARGMVRVED
jgi:hypothetical protein